MTRQSQTRPFGERFAVVRRVEKVAERQRLWAEEAVESTATSWSELQTIRTSRDLGSVAAAAPTSPLVAPAGQRSRNIHDRTQTLTLATRQNALRARQ